MRLLAAAALLATTTAHAAVVAETVAVVPNGLIVSFTTGPAAAPQAVLLPLPAPAIASRADPAALDALLVATAPRLSASFDADPCFPHPVAPAAPPALALSALPGLPVPVAFATFPAPGQARSAWLQAHGVSPDPPTPGGGPVLAIVLPPAATAAPVRLDFAAPPPAASLVAASAATVVLLGQGPLALQGRIADPAPGGAALPEFVYGQFGHVFAAMLSSARAPVVLDFAGKLPDGYATRLELRGPAAGLIPIVAAPATPTHATTFATRIGWKGEYTLACTQGFAYRRALTARWQAENAALAALTGWRPADIRQAMVDEWKRSVQAQQPR